MQIQTFLVAALLTVNASAAAVFHVRSVADGASPLEARSLNGDILSEHNRYRKIHHANPLTWSQTLADYASPNAHSCNFHHTDHGKYGENIAAGYSSTIASVQAWGNEGDKYKYDGKYTSDTGHFTQIVWKATKEVGCAQVDCKDILAKGITSTYLVCEYNPPGNVIGQFTQNVQRA